MNKKLLVIAALISLNIFAGKRRPKRQPASKSSRLKAAGDVRGDTVPTRVYHPKFLQATTATFNLIPSATSDFTRVIHIEQTPEERKKAKKKRIKALIATKS